MQGAVKLDYKNTGAENNYMNFKELITKIKHVRITSIIYTIIASFLLVLFAQTNSSADLNIFNDDKGKKGLSFGLDDRRVIISRIHLFINGDVRGTIPYGYGLVCCCDQGMDELAGGRYSWMPGFRIEGGYLNFKNNGASLRGATWSCGPVWLISLNNNRFGNIVLGGTFGMSYLKIENEYLRGRSNAFTAWAVAGYEYSFNRIIVQVQTRYMYIHDNSTDMHNIGGGLFGIGFKV